jgi:hypothetical protein
MLEFEKQHRCIAWHADAAAAGNIFPFIVHGSKFIAGHVVLDAMEFLEDTKEVVVVFQAHVFDAKVRGSGGKNVIFSNSPNSTSECLKLLY